MYKQAVAVLFTFLFIASLSVSFAQVSVGVKAGDWIEYDVEVTGNPPEEHDVTHAKIEILAVQDSEIHVNLISEIRNGTRQVVFRILNLEEGALGVWFIIPANLDVGDTFYDRNAPPPGIFTIQSVEDMTYAGARRAVSFSPSYFEEYKRWDKITGVFVEGLGIYENYTIHTIAQNTNMWVPQIFGIDPIIFYTIVGIIIFLALLIITIVILKSSKKHNIA
jgi:hypothetical protein